MSLIDSQAIDRAFRAGLTADPGGRADGLGEDEPIGPSEAVVLQTRRMAGLPDADAAFETGQTLRLIARLFDQAHAPARITEQFRDNLAAAIMGESMRAGGNWQRKDTIEMFLDMYDRILNVDDDELAKARRYLAGHNKPKTRRKGLISRVDRWLGRSAA